MASLRALAERLHCLPLWRLQSPDAPSTLLVGAPWHVVSGSSKQKAPPPRRQQASKAALASEVSCGRCQAAQQTIKPSDRHALGRLRVLLDGIEVHVDVGRVCVDDAHGLLVLGHGGLALDDV